MVVSLSITRVEGGKWKGERGEEYKEREGKKWREVKRKTG